MAQLTVYSGKAVKTLSVPEGTVLEDALFSAGFPPAMPCGGNHTCGKCRVRTSGALSAPSEEEARLLGASGDERLACFAKILGDVSVWVDASGVDVLSWAKMPQLHPDGQGYGVAADIGTTTVAVRLYDSSTGEILAEALEGNRQSPFGADIISRIGRADEGFGTDITSAIQIQIREMTQACMKKAGTDSLTCSVVTGNTTMLHFYEGLDAHGIAVSPFVPKSLFGCKSGFSLGSGSVYLPPCIGSYVGADITCAILASGMMEHADSTSLLADIGTNGEIVLMHDGKLWCCSTAAGPAFEGAGLYQGMRAGRGAITGVTIKDGTPSVSVLGSSTAAGICGSGVIDAVRVMLELDVLDETGRIDDAYEGFGAIAEIDGQPAWRLPGSEVYITQKDVRQIQLAKAAVCAGIRTLLDAAGITAEQVDAFYIAGGFGHSMNAESAASIGLFPPELLSKVNIIGNGALAGAALLLLENFRCQQAEDICGLAKELSLSSSPEFMDFYVDAMLFGEE